MKSDVGGQDSGAGFVPLRDESKKIVGILGGERPMAKLIEQQEVRLDVAAEDALVGLVGFGGEEILEHVCGHDGQDRVALCWLP